MKMRLFYGVSSAMFGPLLATLAYAINHFASAGTGLSYLNLVGLLIMSPLVASPVMLVFGASAFGSGILTRDLPIAWYLGLFSVLGGAGYVLLLSWANAVLAPNNFIIPKVREEHLSAYALHFAICLTFTFLVLALQKWIARALEPYQLRRPKKP